MGVAEQRQASTGVFGDDGDARAVGHRVIHRSECQRRRRHHLVRRRPQPRARGAIGRAAIEPRAQRRLVRRIDLGALQRAAPGGAQLDELVQRRREQGEPQAARQLAHRQRAGRGHEYRRAFEGRVPLAPIDAHADLGALHRAALVGVGLIGGRLACGGRRLFQLLCDVRPAVEPDVPEGRQLRMIQQLETALDVIAVDMRDDQQFQLALVLGQRRQAGRQRAIGTDRSAVDQHAMGPRRVAIAQQQAVAVPRRQQLDAEDLGHGGRGDALRTARAADKARRVPGDGRPPPARGNAARRR